MTAENSILVGTFDGFAWIRCEGKGSFLTSPALKEFAEQRIASGERRLVIDLEACTGMDSTFMGTLAGLSTKLAAPGGTLQVMDANDRNRRSLEDLGLDFLLEINPSVASWQAGLEAIRKELLPAQTTSTLAMNERARHVLDAHKQLSATSHENERKFAGVVSLLEAEIASKPASDQ